MARSEATDGFTTTLERLQRQSAINRQLPGATDQPIGTVIACPRCRQLIELKQTKASYKGQHARIWSDCACITRAIDDYTAFAAKSGFYAAEQRTTGPTRSDIGSVAHMTFANFDSTRYTTAYDPAVEARNWIDYVLHDPHGDYDSGVPVCFWLYSDGKGRGKTHLAAACAAEVAVTGASVYFADETRFIERYWAASLEEKADLSDVAGRRAHLTILDDLGRRERTTDSLRDAWNAVINPRWLKRGWTIVTSNWTPDGLMQRGTINEATYSRLIQMTAGVVIKLESADYRLEALR